MMKKRGALLIAVIFTALLGVFVIQQTFAAAGQIFISPSSGSVQKGSNISVDVRINPGSATDGAEATVTYDTAKLQFVSQSGSGSPYPIELQATGGGGTVKMTRGHLTGTVSANNSLITRITFKALVGGTTASLSLSGNSTTSGAYNNPTTSGANITLTNPTTSTPKPPSSSTKKPTTSSPKPTTTTTKPTTTTGSSTSTTTKPKVEQDQPTVTSSGKTIELSKLFFKQVEFKISGSKPFKAYIQYGVDGQLNIDTPATGFAKEHTIALNKDLLVPGTTYSFAVVTQDQGGPTETSDTQTFKTKGCTVNVTVLAKNNQPLKNQLVTLHSDPMTARTDDKGVAVFQEVSPGQHTLEYIHGKEKVSQGIEVADSVVVGASSDTADPQNFSVVFGEVSASSSLPVAVIVGGVAVLLLFIIGFILYRSGKLGGGGNHTFVGPGGATVAGPPPTNVIGGGGGVAPPPANPTTPVPNPEVDQLLNHVPAGNRVDPGSVINPQDNDQPR